MPTDSAPTKGTTIGSVSALMQPNGAPAITVATDAQPATELGIADIVEGAIIKREWWREWAADKPPKCHVILQSWDTAHETKTSADPSAVTTWGLFINEEEQDQDDDVQARPSSLMTSPMAVKPYS